MQKRQLSKSSIFMIIILILISVFYIIFNKYNLTQNAFFLVTNAGYNNISDFKAYSSQAVIDKAKDIKGKQYFVSFVDNNLKKECFGYVIAVETGKIIKKIDCK